MPQLKAFARPVLMSLCIGGGLAYIAACGHHGSSGDSSATPDAPVIEATLPIDPQAEAALAACMNLDPTEVVPAVGWGDATTANAAATAICTPLGKINFKAGISATELAVDIDA